MSLKSTTTYCFLLLWSLFLTSEIAAQQRNQYFDGPYIFHQNDSLSLQWIEGGVPYDTVIAQADATVFEREGLPYVNLQQLAFPTDKASVYTDVERIVAISDVHGQYELMHDILLASGVIDDHDNWALGQGHLVVVGDNFNRGTGVLPILWLFFKLEQQALAQGGRVHMLLGNHELMILQGDLRYLDRKYLYTSGAFKTPYQNFFATGSVLGDWIAHHQAVISINEHLFIHAGVSPEVVNLKLSLDELNTIFREQIMRQPVDSLSIDPVLTLLEGNLGPMWYRGYFEDQPLPIGKVNKSLKRWGVQKIIIGHTSQERIKALYSGKVIVIDCDIKSGERGEVLIIEKDQTYTIDQNGAKNPIAAALPPPVPESIQDRIFQSTTRPRLSIATNFQRLILKKMDEEYMPAEVNLTVDDWSVALAARVRARGNIRKQVCPFPPLMLDFKKSELQALGFLKHDKLKLVIPCHKVAKMQNTLLKEFLAYELYDIVEPLGIQTQLIDITIITPKETLSLTGFLIETEQDYAHRTGAEVLGNGRVSASVLDRERFVRTQFFQYMIANCDWSLSNRHNLEIVKYPSIPQPVALAYDFDYAGFCGNSYAVPADILPIKSVHERYFFSYKTTTEEIDTAITYFLAREQALYDTCAAASYLDIKTIERCRNYLASFFELLRNPQKFKKRIGKA